MSWIDKMGKFSFSVSLSILSLMDVVESNFMQLNDGALKEEGTSANNNIRSDMVDAAYRFMLTPKVRDTSFEQQKEFLVRKGLTETEITEARKRADEAKMNNELMFGRGNCLVPNNTIASSSASSSGSFMSFLNAAVSVGCLSYAGYRLIRSFILPRFFNVPDPAIEEQRQIENQINELQNSMKFVMDSVVQTLKKVEEQQECLNRAVSLLSPYANGDHYDSKQLQSDVSAIKSLLLNPTIQFNNNDTRIPFWQQGPRHDRQGEGKEICKPLMQCNDIDLETEPLE